MENGYMRPRYNGYLHFQDHAGDIHCRNTFVNGGDPEKVLKEMNKIYQQSFINQ